MTAVVRKVAIVLAAFVLAGCATNWQSRVGVYTYDQAVKDYGPPVSLAKLSDGSEVAEWKTRQSQVIMSPRSYVYGPGFYGSYYGPGWGAYSSTYYPSRYLRLTFSPEGKLEDWKEFSK